LIAVGPGFEIPDAVQIDDHGVETRLDPARFARIHRTVIVNLDRIRYLDPWSHGDQLVVLESGARLTLSRRFRDRMPGTLGEQP